MAVSTKHIDRIRKELQEAGLSPYALKKGESKNLPALIHSKEHVHAAIMGRRDMVTNAMLVATDRKVLYLQYSPLFMNTDEITYEVVSGVTFGRQGMTNALVLHTKIGDFKLQLVNAQAAERFITYIEKRRLEGDGDVVDQEDARRVAPVMPVAPRTVVASEQKPHSFNRKERDFVESHELSVLSTLGTDGRVSGSAVYYMFDGSRLFIVTKEGTEKAQNILKNPQVALTITDESAMATMQIDATASVETDNAKRQTAFDAIVRQRQYKSGVKYPPVTTINAGGFVILRLTPTTVRYNEFSQR